MKARTSIIIETLLHLSLTLSGLYVVLMSGPAGSLVWCLIAATYVIFRLVRLRVPGRDRTPTARSIRTRLAFALLASAVGLTGALNAVITPADYGFDEVAVPMILLAWAVLHFGYSDVYRDEAAMALARGETPAIEFAGDATPEPSDYVYFAFTLGISFATSDSSVITPHMRRIATWHGVLSFLYNTAIVGVAINLITSYS